MPIDRIGRRGARSSAAHFRAGWLPGVALFLVIAATCGEPTAPKPSLPPLSALDVLGDSLSFVIGDSLVIGVEASAAAGGYADRTNAEWLSRDPDVVSLTAPGIIRAMSTGRSWIVARSGALADSVLAISRPRLPLVLGSHTDTMKAIGDSLSLQALVDGGAVPPRITWGTRDTTVALVNPSGTVVSRGSGSTWVVALEDGGSMDSTQLVVRQALARVDVVPVSISRPLMRTQRFSATPRDSRGVAIADLAMAWSSADESVASVDAGGLVTTRGVGSTEIRATSDGVTGSATLSVSPLPPLRFNSDTFEVGVGQYPSSWHRPQPRVVADSLEPDESVTVTLASSDATIATVSATSVLPESSNEKTSAPVLPVGVAPGVVTLTASADRYAPGHTVLRVTTPTLALSSGQDTVFATGTIDATGGIDLHVATGDSLGHAHHNVAPVAIRIRSSNPAVVAPADTTITAEPESGGIGMTARGIALGNAWLVVTANGYRPDSVLLTVQPRRLHFKRYFLNEVGHVAVGVTQATTFQELAVEVDSRSGTDQVVTLTSLRSRASVPTSITAPAFTAWAYLAVTGVTAGRDTIVASAAGYAPDTLVVDVGTPHYGLSATPATTRVTNVINLSVIVSDSLGTMRVPASGAKRVVLTSTDPTVLRPMADTLVVDDGSAGANFAVEAFALGTAGIVASDPDGVAATYTSPPITVQPAPMQVGVGQLIADPAPITLGLRQRLPVATRPYVFIQEFYSRRHITLTSTDPSIVLPEPAGVETNDYVLFFNIVAGDRTGTAWIVASAPGMTTDSIPVVVGQPVARLVAPPPSFQGDLAPMDSLRIAVFDQAGQPRVSVDPVTFALASSNASILTADETTITVPAGAGVSNATKLHFHAEGTASLRAVDARNVPWSFGTVTSQLIEVNATGQRVLATAPGDPGSITRSATPVPSRP